MTADGRYGPYGFGEDDPTYERSRVDWDTLDWGRLVDQCLERNAHRFPTPIPSANVAHAPRFALRPPTTEHDNNDATGQKEGDGPLRLHHHDDAPTMRTALVLRSYEGFEYTDEVMWMIRALITEATLKSGGRYGVILLVNVQDKEWAIHESREHYDRAFQAMQMEVPPELWSLMVLWDEALLESWYPLVTEWRTMWQVNQPLQLLAHHYPEYDHFWQLEMDQRFMGDTLEYLEAMEAFARAEPRKQALERATFPYSEDLYSSYADLMHRVDAANHGGSRAWGALCVPDVEPMGPRPPTAHAEKEHFRWGVGDEADVILTSFCEDVRASSDWVFHDWWRGGLELGIDTPRFFCPPAIARASRTLLRAVHDAQVATGISVPSEATLPSWAAWLGLKLSYPPQPVYAQPVGDRHTEEDEEEQEDHIENDSTVAVSGVSSKKAESDKANAEEHDDGPDPFFYDGFENSLVRRKTHPRPLPRLLGSTPEESRDGLAHAKPQSPGASGLTHWWASEYPRQVMDAWMGKGRAGRRRAIPPMLATHGGEVYAPNFAMHPVK